MKLRKLPDSLKRAISGQHLAILCGAGISITPPSSLPSWWMLNSIILEEICSAAQKYLPTDFIDDLNSLEINNIPVQSLSDEIVNIIAGHNYFPILRFLDSACTNPNHKALASLAKSGSLRAIISTNFDTLIERAFRENGIPLKTYVHMEDYFEPFPHDTCVLLKVHGSADDPETMIDTFSQKLSGLPEIVRQRVSEIANDNHVLVLGFSGADLEFAADYLTLNPAGQNWRGLSWLKRREDHIKEEALLTILRTGTGAALLLGDLPNFFTDLGLDVTASPSETDATHIDKEQVRSGVRDWLSGDDIGPELCVVFCVHMLAKIGKYEKARHIREYLGSLPAIVSPFSGSEIELAKAFRLTGVYRGLAVGASHDNDWDDVLSWSDLEIAVYSFVLELLQQHEDTNAEATSDVRRKLTGAQLNKAAAYRYKGEIPKARQLLEQVLEVTEDAELMSSVLCNLAVIALEEGGNPNQMLKLTQRARALAPGRPATLIESYAIDAKIFLAAGTAGVAGAYDHAINAIDAGLRMTKLYGTLAFQCELLLYKFQVYLHCNDFPQARATVEELIQSADNADALGASIRIVLIPRLKVTPELADLVDQMLLWLEETLAKFPKNDPRIHRYHALKEYLAQIANN